MGDFPLGFPLHQPPNKIEGERPPKRFCFSFGGHFRPTHDAEPQAEPLPLCSLALHSSRALARQNVIPTDLSQEPSGISFFVAHVAVGGGLLVPSKWVQSVPVGLEVSRAAPQL